MRAVRIRIRLWETRIHQRVAVATVTDQNLSCFNLRPLTPGLYPANLAYFTAALKTKLLLNKSVSSPPRGGDRLCYQAF